MKEVTGEKPQMWGELARLGKHTTGKTRLYLKRLGQVDQNVLTELLRKSVAHVQDVEAEAGGLPRISKMPPPSQ